MISKFGFTKMDILEFENWISTQKVARTIRYIQQHHTWSPTYSSFKTNNHFEIQQGMKNYHVGTNGWMDIGQHFTTFPDGTILTGRSLEQSPACITGFNSGAICIENLGNFDLGKDQMTAAHKDTIVRLTAALCKKFGIAISSDQIVYHHWFNLSTGERNNGTKNNKTCPGTNFFGGNKVADCDLNFLPLVKQVGNGGAVQPNILPLKYAYVNADRLNIRAAADAKSSLITDRDALTLGAILRVYEIKNGWYRISSSAQHWVNGNYTKAAERLLVNASTLNIRSGPGTTYAKVGTLKKDDEVFITEEENGWSKISSGYQWVKTEFLV